MQEMNFNKLLDEARPIDALYEDDIEDICERVRLLLPQVTGTQEPAPKEKMELIKTMLKGLWENGPGVPDRALLVAVFQALASHFPPAPRWGIVLFMMGIQYERTRQKGEER